MGVEYNQFSVTFFAFREIFLQWDAIFSDFMFTFATDIWTN